MQDTMFPFCIYEFTSFYLIRTATAVLENVVMMTMTMMTMTVTCYLVLMAEHEIKGISEELAICV
jgi:chromosome condensin MukBEF MukE localization factor